MSSGRPTRAGERTPAALHDMSAGVTTVDMPLGWARELPEGRAVWLPTGPLAFGGHDGSVRLIDEHLDVVLGRFDGPVLGLQVDPASGRFAATDGRRVKQWDVTTRALIADVVPPFKSLERVGFTGAGALRLSGTLDADARCTSSDAICARARRGQELDWEQERGLLEPTQWAPLFRGGMDKYGLAVAPKRVGDRRDGAVVLPGDHWIDGDIEDAWLSADGAHVLVQGDRLEVRSVVDGVSLPRSARWRSGHTTYAFDPRSELVVLADQDGLRRWSMRTGVPVGGRFGAGCDDVGWDDRGDRFAARCGADVVVFDREGKEAGRTASESVDRLEPAQWLAARDAWWFAGGAEGVLWHSGLDAVPAVYEVDEQHPIERVVVGPDGRRAVVKRADGWWQANLGEDRLTVGLALPIGEKLEPQDVLPTADPDTWVVSYGDGLQWIDGLGAVHATLPDGYAPDRHRAPPTQSAEVARELHAVRTGVCADLGSDDQLLAHDQRLSHDAAFLEDGEVVELATGRLVTQLDARALMVSEPGGVTVDAAGRWLLVQDSWGGVMVFDLTAVQGVRRLPDVGVVKLYEGGRLVVTGHDEVQTVDLETGAPVATLAVKGGVFGAAQRDIVLARDDSALVLVSLPGLTEVARVPVGVGYPSVEHAPDGRLVWVSGEFATRLIDVARRQVVMSLPFRSNVAWASDGTPAWTEDGRPTVWVDGEKRVLPERVVLPTPAPPEAPDPEHPRRLAAPPAPAPRWDGARIVFSVDRHEQTWDPRTGEVVAVRQSGWVPPVVPPLPDHVHVTLDDRVLRVWNADATLKAEAIVFWDGDFALFTAGKAIGRDRAARVVHAGPVGPDMPVFPSWDPPITPLAPVPAGTCRDARGDP